MPHMVASAGMQAKEMEQQEVLPPAAPGQAAVEVAAGSFAWQPDGEPLLHDINLAGAVCFAVGNARRAPSHCCALFYAVLRPYCAAAPATLHSSITPALKAVAVFSNTHQLPELPACCSASGLPRHCGWLSWLRQELPAGGPASRDARAGGQRDCAGQGCLHGAGPMDPGEQGVHTDLLVEPLNREAPSHRWPGVLSCHGWLDCQLSWSLCSCMPRLQNATLRDNVLLGGPLDKQR